MRHLMRYSIAIFGLSLSFPVMAADGVTVENGWTRATPPGAVNSATYVTIKNAGDNVREIVAAHSEAAKDIQIHTVIDDNGLMKMRQVQQLEIPAGGAVELKPGGFHIMMLGVVAPLSEGKTITVELEFANGERIGFESNIQKAATEKGMDHSKMDHGKMDHSKVKHE